MIVPTSLARHAWGKAIREGGAAAVGLREWRAIHVAAHVPHFPSDTCDTQAGVAWAEGRSSSLIAIGRARNQARVRASASTVTPPQWSSLWTEAVYSTLPIVIVRRLRLAREVLKSCSEGTVPTRSRALVMANFILPARGRPPPAGSPVSLIIGGIPIGFILNSIHSPSGGGRAIGLIALRADDAATLYSGKGVWRDAIVCGHALRIVALVDDRGE